MCLVFILLVKRGSWLPCQKLWQAVPEDTMAVSDLLWCPSFSPLCLPPLLSVSVGVKSAYSPAPSTVYSQPPPPQRQVTALKPLAPCSSVSTSYNIYPVSTSVQQPPTSISSYTLGSSFNSTASATSYSGEIRDEIAPRWLLCNKIAIHFVQVAMYCRMRQHNWLSKYWKFPAASTRNLRVFYNIYLYS